MMAPVARMSANLAAMRAPQQRPVGSLAANVAAMFASSRPRSRMRPPVLTPRMMVVGRGGAAQTTHPHKGRSYPVLTGARGGRYIVVAGTKIYI